MNGLGVGGVGVAYHSEDDYDDGMYGNGGGMMASPGGMMGTNLSKLSSVMPNYASTVPPGPLSSLHGMASQAQLLPPSHHHSPSAVPSAYVSSSSVGPGLGGLHAAPSVASTPSSAGGRSQNTCCLIDDGRKCGRNAGNASYSKRVQKTVLHKRLRLETDSNVQHIYICDYHKMIIQNARTRQKKESDEELMDGNPDDVPEVDLYQLQVNTLRRYKKHYKISSRPGLNKAQLADILMRHFKTIPVQEKEIVTYFIYMVKAERNKLDNTRPEPLQQAAGHAMADYQSVRYN